MRKILTLLFYVLMVASGLLLADHGGRGIVLLTGGFLAIFGAFLIWTDFPLLIYILMVVAGFSLAVYGSHGTGLLVGGVLAAFGALLIWTGRSKANAE